MLNSWKEKYRNYVFYILLYKHTKNLFKLWTLIKKFLAVFKYFLQHTQCQHHDKSACPSEAVEKGPVLCERLHEGLAAVVDSEGRDLQQQQTFSLVTEDEAVIYLEEHGDDVDCAVK